MAEVLAIRVGVFFVAYFALQVVMFRLIQRPKRGHGLVLLAFSTLIAFLAGFVLLEDSLGETLLAWLVIYAAIAVAWFVGWRGQDYERLRRELLAPDEVLDRHRPKE